MLFLLEKFLETNKVSTDTRQIVGGEIFFALSGPNFDGNRFAKQALDLGAKWAVVSDKSLNGEKFIHVEDTLKALQQLALNYRKTLDIPIIAIAGSNGKTTTKELMGAVLNTRMNCFVTKGNLNNYIGLPISILSIGRDHQAAVIEMGANQPGDYEELCRICQPSHGLITNMGKDHLEGFGGMAGVVKAHEEFVAYFEETSGLLFVNADDESLNAISGHCPCRHFYGGPQSGVKIESSAPYLKLEIPMKGGWYSEILTNLTGDYNLTNILAALAVGDFFGIETEAAHKAISNYVPWNNRSQIVKTNKGNTVILDCYNSNPSSAEAALKNLAAQPNINKVFVLGDMFELGEYAEEEHREILKIADRLSLNGYTVGTEFHQLDFAKFPSFALFDDLKKHLESNPLFDTLILLKGSRGMALERILDAL